MVIDPYVLELCHVMTYKLVYYKLLLKTIEMLFAELNGYFLCQKQIRSFKLENNCSYLLLKASQYLG